MSSSIENTLCAVQPLAFELPAPDITAWRAGNTGTEGVWHFDSGLPGRHVMVSALVHGNELCGAWALKGLLEAGVRPQQGTLTLAFCNLDAFDRFDPRHHDASRFTDEDLNRQWLDARIDAGDTRERRRAAALRPFVARADWLLDIHSMHEPSAPLLLTGMQPRNLELARALRTLETAMTWESVQDSWRNDRAGWVSRVDAATTVPQVAQALIDLETATKWEACQDSWRNDRAGWLNNVRAQLR